MTSVADLLNRTFAHPPFFETGLGNVDQVLGGLSAGQVWLVIGHPGQGKSTLVTQLAFQLAVNHNLGVTFASPVDSSDVVRARLLALAGSRPLSFPWPRTSGPVSGASDALYQAHLEIETDGAFGQPQRSKGPDRQLCWVVDDVHHAGDAAPQALRAAADDGLLVVASAPRHLVVNGSQWGDPLGFEWASSCDVIVEIQADAPGEHPPGEAHLLVHRNRVGPRPKIPLLDQCWTARFSTSTGDPTTHRT